MRVGGKYLARLKWARPKVTLDENLAISVKSVMDNAEGSLRDPVETTRWTPDKYRGDDIVRHSK